MPIAWNRASLQMPRVYNKMSTFLSMERRPGGSAVPMAESFKLAIGNLSSRKWGDTHGWWPPLGCSWMIPCGLPWHSKVPARYFLLC